MRTCLAFTTLALVWSVPALACSPLPTAFVGVAPKIAQGGVVGFAECRSECDGFGEVTVVDADGVSLPGAVQTDGDQLFWRPAQPLKVGQRYTLRVASPSAATRGRGGGEFEVVASLEPELSSVGFSVGARSIDTASSCCSGYTTPIGGCGPSCTVTRREGQVRVEVSVAGAEAMFSQWWLSVTITDGPYQHSYPLSAFDGYRTEQQTTTLQGRYCVRVEAVALGGDEMRTLHEECKDVDLTLPEGWSATPESIASFQASCGGTRDAGVRDAGASDAGARDAEVRDADARAPSGRDANVEEADASAPGGCQLGEDRAGTLMTVLVLLGLAASGSRRRARMPRKDDREDA